MRVIVEGQAPKPVEKTEGERDINVPGNKIFAEVVCTCTRCLTKFGFTIQDEGVTLDNEGDFNVDCPTCGQPLLVGKTTGIVIQRQGD